MTELPSTPSGLADLSTESRAPFIEAFRQVVVRWPNVPSCVRYEKISRHSPSVEVLRLEREIVRFYLDSFFLASGRAAIIPRIPPV